MKKRVFIVHGWSGNSKEGWIPWLQKELESLGYETYALDMPDTDHPKIDQWLETLENAIGEPDTSTYLVGISIGANAVLRYLESIERKKIGGAVLIAPYYGEVYIKTGEAKKMAVPWLETPIDFEKVKHAANNFVAIFSDNDQSVMLENKDFLSQKLPLKVIVEHNKGHFREWHGVFELPSALEAVLSFSK